MTTIRELAENTGIDRSEVSELLVSKMKEGWLKTFRRKEGGPITWILTDEGRKVLPPSTPEGYASIGGPEAQGLALTAREHYLSRGWFFALARQETAMRRRVDCVAYDYTRRLAAAVEIESSAHVLRDHVEQVKRHLMEISPFDEVHFWAHLDAADRIKELKNGLRPEDQPKVKIYSVEDDTPVQPHTGEEERLTESRIPALGATTIKSQAAATGQEPPG